MGYYSVQSRTSMIWRSELHSIGHNWKINLNSRFKRCSNKHSFIFFSFIFTQIKIIPIFYLVHYGWWWNLGFVVFHYILSIGRNQELGEVPWNLICRPRCSIVDRGIGSQEIIDWMSIFTVHIDFLKNGELGFVLLSSKLFNLRSSTGLLVFELVAWESKYLQTLLAILFVNLN